MKGAGLKTWAGGTETTALVEVIEANDITFAVLLGMKEAMETRSRKTAALQGGGASWWFCR